VSHHLERQPLRRHAVEGHDGRQQRHTQLERRALGSLDDQPAASGWVVCQSKARRAGGEGEGKGRRVFSDPEEGSYEEVGNAAQQEEGG